MKISCMLVAGQQQSIKISKTAKTPKRTKSGLLPWWVRKRLQEKSEGKPESGGTQRRSRKPKKKALPKHVQVWSSASLLMQAVFCISTDEVNKELD